MQIFKKSMIKEFRRKTHSNIKEEETSAVEKCPNCTVTYAAVQKAT